MEINFIDRKVYDYIFGLDVISHAKAIRMIELLREFGNEIGMPHSKKISRRIFELRVRGKCEIRILYTYFDGGAVLLHAFQKKSQKLPMKELDIAQLKLSELDNV